MITGCRGQIVAREQILAAWNSEITAEWNPNVSPVIHVTAEPPHRVLTAVEALSERPRPPRFVTFTVRYSLTSDQFVIMGELDGFGVPVHHDELQRGPAG